jgi:ribosomal-protein-alanine N-acetyltransferase
MKQNHLIDDFFIYCGIIASTWVIFMIKDLGTKPLETKRLILRSIKYTDAEELLDLFNDHRVSALDGSSPVESLCKVHDIIGNWGFTSLFLDSFYCWGIVLREENKLIGMIKKDYDSLELGMSINYNYWGRGYGTEALTEVLRFLLDEVGYPQLEAYCIISNDRSRKMIERCGFKFVNEESRISSAGNTIDTKKYVISR